MTGASSGLGVAFARGLAEAGADIVVAARRVERLAETKELVRAVVRRALAFGADVSRPADCQNVVDRALAEFGAVDTLIDNAGISSAVPATRE